MRFAERLERFNKDHAEITRQIVLLDALVKMEKAVEYYRANYEDIPMSKVDALFYDMACGLDAIDVYMKSSV